MRGLSGHRDTVFRIFSNRHDAGSFATVVSIRPEVLPWSLQACWKARMRSPNSDATNADSVVMEPM